MFANLRFGPLSAPLAGTHWDEATVRKRYRCSLSYYSSLGLVRGDRVFMHHGNTLEFFVDLAAVWSLGGCAIPIDGRLTPFEVETLARAAKPRLALWPADANRAVVDSLAGLSVKNIEAAEAYRSMPAARLPPGSQMGLDDDALILFTSGTTGQPKGVVHTHRSLRAKWTALNQSLGIDAFQRTLCLLPTHFGHGLICNCLYPWLSGQELFVTPPFRPDIILELGTLLDEHDITFMSSVPSVWRLALKTAKPPSGKSLRRVFCGSAPLSGHLWQEVQRWTAAPEVWNAYGITETGSWLAGSSMPDFSPDDGLIGQAWGSSIRVMRSPDAATQLDPDDECPVSEEGHVWVNTPSLMRGYYNRADLTAGVVAGGWFSTGDIGIVDERGWLYLRGRERDEINKGGMKVHPADIDAVAERFQQTVDVCTFAIEDAMLGEDIGIALVLQQNDDATRAAMREWMSRHLGVHQMPRRWWVLEEIPRTSRGKINRSDVAERCAGIAPVSFGARSTSS